MRVRYVTVLHNLILLCCFANAAAMVSDEELCQAVKDCFAPCIEQHKHELFSLAEAKRAEAEGELVDEKEAQTLCDQLGLDARLDIAAALLRLKRLLGFKEEECATPGRCGRRISRFLGVAICSGVGFSERRAFIKEDMVVDCSLTPAQSKALYEGLVNALSVSVLVNGRKKLLIYSPGGAVYFKDASPSVEGFDTEPGHQLAQVIDGFLSELPQQGRDRFPPINSGGIIAHAQRMLQKFVARGLKCVQQGLQESTRLLDDFGVNETLARFQKNALSLEEAQRLTCQVYEFIAEELLVAADARDQDALVAESDRRVMADLVARIKRALSLRSANLRTRST